jgi:hypothetical protein
MGDSIVYKNLNPYGPCSDPANQVLINTDLSFPPEAYKCINGRYEPFSFAALTTAINYPFSAFWKLSTLVDSLGGRTMTNNNGATFVPGKLGNCARFIRANSQSLSLTPVDSGLLWGVSSWTLSCWFRASVLTGTQTPISCWSNDAPTNGWFLRLEGGLLEMNFYVDGQLIVVSSTFTIVDSNYHYILFWWDSSTNRMNFRLDNGAVFTSAAVQPLRSDITNAKFFIGGSTFEWFDGDIDAVGWGKFVPTNMQQNGLWNTGVGLELG